MPGKLVYFITVMLIVALFIGMNLSNRCDISVIFYIFKDVPIFLSMIFAFLLGNIAVVPFLFNRGQKTRKSENPAAVYPDVTTVELKNEKHGWFGKKKEKEYRGASDADV